MSLTVTYGHITGLQPTVAGKGCGSSLGVVIVALGNDIATHLYLTGYSCRVSRINACLDSWSGHTTVVANHWVRPTLVADKRTTLGHSITYDIRYLEQLHHIIDILTNCCTTDKKTCVFNILAKHREHL